MFEAILKYLLQILNEYGELETVEPGDRVEALLVAAVEASGTGGIAESNFITNCNFWVFLFFLVVMEVA